jgi:Tol biopolymer transport system component
MEVRIAPDLKKVALLERVREAVAPRDKESHFRLGTVCRLSVYDVNTGCRLYEAPDLALNEGLCWTNDSKAVLFSSLRDKNLAVRTVDGLPPLSYGREDAKRGQFPIDLLLFDLATNSVKTITEGVNPNIVPSTGEITFLREKGGHGHELWRFDPKTGKTTLLVGNVRSYRHAVSPSGRRLLVQIPQKQPLQNGSFLTVIEVGGTSRKLVLQPSQSFGLDFRWVP